MNIFWFRRDLRLDDNAALFNALNQGNVLPVFILDTNVIGDFEKDDPRLTFIWENLFRIHSELSAHGSGLAIFFGDPKKIFKTLIAENNVENVFANAEYEPYSIARDREISELLQQNKSQLRLFKDYVIFESDEILKDNGSPYVVFTPYSKKWLQKLDASPRSYFPSEKHLGGFSTHDYEFRTLEELGFQKSDIEVPKINPKISDYQKTKDFPALATSHLGPHLRFGTMSIRNAVYPTKDRGEASLLRELIWREFFIQILGHFPQTATRSFKPEYDSIKWRNNELEFTKWTQGKTGYPIVDAGIRELNATGFMHNRVRMVVAGFLCKHLLIDWRFGEAYFAQKLIDYDMASNVGNWQWAAGSGVDAAPYFRIFNPIAQASKFDKDFLYIKKWVPEFGTADYPEPMVDHKAARERCIRIYKEALYNR